MKYFENTYNNEYEITLTGLGDEITKFERDFYEKVVSDKDYLFEKSQGCINSFVDLSKDIFDGGLNLNSINIKGTSERSYEVEVEGYYDNDNDVFWYVTFNVPLIAANKNSLESATYWPIELKRRVA